MNEDEKEIAKKFERLYLKDFNNEKITNEDRLSFIECALLSNFIEKLQKENKELKEKENKIYKEVQEITELLSKRSAAMSYDSGTSFLEPHLLLRLLIRS